MTSADQPLSGRLRSHLTANRWIRSGDRVVVACSGGADSLALSHLFRFRLADLGAHPHVAHFDHRMRPESGEDAEWLRGLCGAWNVPYHLGRAETAPSGETEARDLRYEFLTRLKDRLGARWIVTAHHSDDQVETVLFRLLRGTGIEGLRAIPPVREPGILRPLLPFTRDELAKHVRASGLRPRVDPTNRHLHLARNRIRHEVLPLLERVRPGTSRILLRLSADAVASVDLLDRMMAPVIERVTVERSPDRVVLDRPALLELDGVERTEVLRRIARSLGAPLSRTGTGTATEFTMTGSSGGRVMLSGGLTLGRSFDRITIERRPESGADPAGRTRESRPLVIGAPGEGEGEVVCSGRPFRVVWGEARRGPWEWGGFDPSALRFPLRLRSWRAGDRTRTDGGGKKLKKLFGEMRIPEEERHRIPLLVDGDDRVIWIPGRHRWSGIEGRWLVGVRDPEGL